MRRWRIRCRHSASTARGLPPRSTARPRARAGWKTANREIAGRLDAAIASIQTVLDANE